MSRSAYAATIETSTDTGCACVLQGRGTTAVRQESSARQDSSATTVARAPSYNNNSDADSEDEFLAQVPLSAFRCFAPYIAWMSVKQDVRCNLG